MTHLIAAGNNPPMSGTSYTFAIGLVGSTTDKQYSYAARHGYQPAPLFRRKSSPLYPDPCRLSFTDCSWSSSLITRATRRIARYMLRQRGWLAGWLASWVSVTRRYCIKTAKPILKLFDHLVPHHSSFFRPLCRYPIPRGTPSAGALNTQGWGKLAIFVRFLTEIAVYQ